MQMKKPRLLNEESSAAAAKFTVKRPRISATVAKALLFHSIEVCFPEMKD